MSMSFRCVACGALIANPPPDDRSCDRCGFDPDNRAQVAEREAAIDAARRDRELKDSGGG